MASEIAPVKLRPPVLDEQDTQSLPNNSQEDSRETLHLSNSQAAELVEKLYGFNVESVRKLGSYGDYNFHVKVFGVGQDHHGYILKVMNAKDSRDEEQITAQTSMMTFLSTRDFQVPRLVQNRWGQGMSLETFERKENGTQVSTDHNVRLLTFLPGILCSDVTLESASLQAAGVYMGRLHQALQDFDHPGLYRPNFKWNLKNLSGARDYLHVLDSIEDQEMIHNVLGLFADKVLSRLEDLPQGPTHADFGGTNILVRESMTNSEGRYQICGVLDFGDVVWNPLVFDVAISLMFYMLTAPDHEGPATYAGHFVRGYESIRPLTPAEWDVLYHCVVGRACQMYVFNEHSVSVEPEREAHIRKDTEGLYETLKFLVETPKAEVDKQMLGTGRV
ncbi:hydroxylysine kinase-like [Branchiostoma lanceolatum]|uniref:hydroxylysine kinase-like n=1 Tax=Branchiostoma lanceolatum TaxID=7740 RepID=UPI00345616B9